MFNQYINQSIDKSINHQSDKSIYWSIKPLNLQKIQGISNLSPATGENDYLADYCHRCMKWKQPHTY